MRDLSRRDLLGGSGLLVGATVLGLNSEVGARELDLRLKIVVVGAHPDDPESGCGGTMARYAEAGHDVVALYLTRGEAGIGGKSHEEAADIRTAEAQKASEILGAKPVFAGQIDGAAVVTNETYDEFFEILEAEKPDIVFTHWPVDSHRDHRAASLLTYDAWLRLKKRFALYYYEVETGEQSQLYCPTDYVDITSTEAKKHAASFAHASQHPEGFYKLHDLMNQFRGMEYGCRYAEAFMRHPQGRSDVDLPIVFHS